ncbi:MAG TPA: VOC family protein [Jatrophihabitantaceae bacterium]|jgi:catechol 2,3-dioxygenase-like lactoylglutathione lyase family enzyme
MDRVRAERFLLDHGADRIDHPGGTLYAHLGRVADQLAAWGASDDVVLAALCHATYGTDGFATALLPVAERPTLADVIGPAAEGIVYLYASCDRGKTYPELGGSGAVSFHDRFTGQARPVGADELRDFMAITAANELDVFAHNAELADRYGRSFLAVLTRARDRLSRPAWAAAQLALSPVAISHLDHFVLTVADIDRTLDFYQQALGMTPVVFGDGRHALEFGDSKINLHRAGNEIAPHADHPKPGSADVCLIAATPIEQVIAHLQASGVPIVEGPVSRTGARGELMSVYLRDPDGNLVEISNYAD